MADYQDMIKADDGKANTLATIHEVRARWKGADHDSMFPVAEAGYRERSG